MDIIGIGLMSGSSIDGLDITQCKFHESDNKWSFEIISSKTVKYDINLRESLKSAHKLSHKELLELDSIFAKWVSQEINKCFPKKDYDFISFHGHTVFHEPELGYSFQLGNAHHIHSATNKPVISDFRSADIANGGQGAPLVPVGEVYLFPEHKGFINLGGIANISIHSENNVLAFDICPFNLALNELANKKGYEFDNKGELAKSGNLIPELFETLSNLEFYKKSGPKSIDRIWYENNFLILITKYISNNLIEDVLHTLIQHFSDVISKVLNDSFKIKDKICISGGGALNEYFIDCLRVKSEPELIIPTKNIIEYKEAIIFAFLGLLKLLNKENTLASVTGAKENSSGGIIYGSTNSLKSKINVGSS